VSHREPDHQLVGPSALELLRLLQLFLGIFNGFVSNLQKGAQREPSSAFRLASGDVILRHAIF
jgi:hypothetical protein